MRRFFSFVRAVVSIGAVALSLAGSQFVSAADAAGASAVPAVDSGILKVKSVYSMAETVDRLKKDVTTKGIKFFFEIDQAKLAADAGIQIRPSVLLNFGNPPLGTLFIRANPLAGLDWPVRVLVYQDEKGDVWAAFTDFAYIARRHAITGKDLESFKTASGVIESITSSVSKK